MTKLTLTRWRGLVALARDGVVEASRAIERVHLETAGRPFGVLAMVPLVAPPTAVVRVIHDSTVSLVHAIIRLTTHAVGGTLDVALHAAERFAAPPDSHP
jgi:hypothetical protein